MRRSVIPVFIPHLGCPHRCVFCDQHRIAQERPPAPQELPALIESALAQADRPQIAFYGGSFTAVERPLMLAYLEAAAPFVRGGRCDSIRLSTRPDAVDEEIAAILRQYGVRTVELGAQSMDDEVLRLAGRGHTAADTARAAALLRGAGFEVILQLMPGLPGSTREREHLDALDCCALKPAAVRLYPTCVVEGTPLCELYRRGAYAPLTLEEAVAVCADMLAVFEHHHIPAVRIGLNPTETLAQSVVAGPYHPAFGELVYGRLFLDRLLPDVPRGRPYELIVPPRLMSVAVGHRRCNLARLREVSDLRAIRAEEGLEAPKIKLL